MNTPRSQQEILQVLQQFQAAYTARDVSRVDRFVADFMAPDTDFVFIGTGSEEWRFGREAAREIFAGDWEGWGDVRLALDEARISTLGDAGWFAVPGTVSQTVDPEQFRAGTLDALRHVCADTTTPAEIRAAEILRTISNTLYETEQGETYIWPFRLCGVLVRQAGRWQFRQVQFSFPTTTTPDERLPEPDLSAKPWAEFARTPDTEAVRSVLKAFQDGYTRRDPAHLDAFLQHFAPDPDLLIVGTGDHEWQTGLHEARELIEGDWLYWGQLQLDVERAMISQSGDVAWLATHGTVTRRHTREQASANLLAWLDTVLKSDLKPREMLLEALRPTAYTFYGTAQGEQYIFPLRFTALLIRRGGRWLFHQMQFSHATLRTPDERRGGLWASPRD